jgi:hypothetical protein
MDHDCRSATAVAEDRQVHPVSLANQEPLQPDAAADAMRRQTAALDALPRDSTAGQVSALDESVVPASAQNPDAHLVAAQRDVELAAEQQAFAQLAVPAKIVELALAASQRLEAELWRRARLVQRALELQVSLRERLVWSLPQQARLAQRQGRAEQLAVQQELPAWAAVAAAQQQEPRVSQQLLAASELPLWVSPRRGLAPVLRHPESPGELLPRHLPG